ncbi:hypothetical protein K439DRAFT_1275370, partial [Ramaria rubella]
PTGQYASHGNVCIFPQDPHALATVLPPPISVFYDEIAIIFVSSTGKEVTHDSLSKSPLLACQGHILNALKWLKEHNPLYADVEISEDILLREYPENGSALGFAIQELLKGSAATSEGSSYTSYTQQANAEAFNDNQSDFIPISTNGILDTDQIDATYKMGKIDAMRKLKTGRVPFVKFASGGIPLQTSYNPSIYGCLWPTLFPYGVGMFEDK